MGLARGLVRSVGSVGRAASVLARTALGLDTNPVPADWRHVTKVDPEPEKRLPVVYPLYLEHTGAISVGGSRDVTGADTEATFALLESVPTPAFHEPSGPRHVTPETREQAAFLAIPEVLNGGSSALVGTLGEGLAYVREEMAPAQVDAELPWLPDALGDRLADFATTWLLERAVFEAYVIQNPDSAAAREGGVGHEDVLSADEAGRRAMAAERHLGSEVLYVEYSGTYGGEEAERVLDAVSDAVSWSRIWYGGGIDGGAKSERMLAAGADAVVVGDAFHEVAEEEADLYAAAREHFDGAPDLGDVEDWLEAGEAGPETGETAAARFLDTIPGVDDAERRARASLAAGISARFAVDDLVASLPDDPSAGHLRATVAEAERLPAEAHLAGVVEEPREAAAALTLGLLADETDVAVEGALPTGHVARAR